MKELRTYITEGIFDIDDNIDQAGNIAIVENFIKEHYAVNDYLEQEVNVDIRKERTKDGKFIVDAQYCDVIVSDKNIKYLTNDMFVWGIVGNFYCGGCSKLKSLEGAPTQATWNFSCNECDSLTSLKGAPSIVTMSFSCQNCKSLKSLIGAPEKTGSFNCSLCVSLKSLKGSPRELVNFDCTGCSSLDSLSGSPKKVSDTFRCEKCAISFDSDYIRRYCGKPQYIFT